jgi:hypothetical protein
MPPKLSAAAPHARHAKRPLDLHPVGSALSGATFQLPAGSYRDVAGNPGANSFELRPEPLAKPLGEHSGAAVSGAAAAVSVALPAAVAVSLILSATSGQERAAAAVPLSPPTTRCAPSKPCVVSRPQAPLPAC